MPNGKWRPDLYNGLFFENVYPGSALNPIGPKTYDALLQGTRDVVAVYDVTFYNAGPQYRRAAATMAIARDALFLFGHETLSVNNPNPTTQDFEHFGLYYGTFSGPATEISPGVWERVGSNGLVVFNESGASYPIQIQSMGVLIL
jgi:hypothetical protein